MAQYDVSSNGADELMKLARNLLSSYEDVIQAGTILEKKLCLLNGHNTEIYTQIINTADKITSRLKREQDNFIYLTKNLMALSARIREILKEGTSLDIRQEYGKNVTSLDTSSFEEIVNEKYIMDNFFESLYNSKTIKLSDPPNGQYLSWINANDIIGVFHNDNIDPVQFWKHHGESKERFFELASRVETVKSLLDQGMSLEQIKQNPDLTACVEQYFSPDRAVRVYKYGNKYIFDGDGRHRVRISQEMGINIPVIIYKEVQEI